MKRRAIGFVAAIGVACNAINGAGELGVGGGSAPDAGQNDVVAPPLTPPHPPPPPPPIADGGADVDAAPCDENDESLLLCVPFERDVLDHASAPLVAASEAGVMFVPGSVGEAAAFSNGGVTYLWAAKLTTLSRITFSAFVKPESLPAVGTRAGIIDSNYRLGMFLLASGLVSCIGGGSTVFNPTHIETQKPIPIRRATHITCLAGGNDVTIYVGGVLDNKLNMSNPIQMNQENITIGMNSPSADDFAGTIDEVRLWSRELSPAEILAEASRK